MLRSRIKPSSLYLSLILAAFFGLGAAPAPTNETKVLKDAQAAFDKHDYDQVVALLNPQVEKLPKKGLLLLGEAYEKNKNALAAVKVYKTAMGRNDKDYEVLVYIARAYSTLSKDDEAIGFLKDALEINKKYEPANFALAEIYEKRKNRYALRLLLEDFEKFASPTRKPEVVARLCAINLLERFHAQAKLKCAEAIQLNPKNPDNYVNLGTAFNETGDIKTGQKHLHRAADSFKGSELAQFTLGQFYADQKNNLKAYTYFKRATEADGKASRSFSALGFAALELQKFGESLAAFTRGCELDRMIEKDLRKAAQIVRLVKADAWTSKFDAAIEKCGAGVFN